VSSERLRFLVTAGPTREYVDDLRFLTNGSTGRMGFAIAAAARAAGHEVLLIAGPTALAAPEGIETVRVVSALEMHEEVLSAYPATDVVVMTAAVADYRPAERQTGKRKKTPGEWNLRLVRNPDILAELGRKRTHQTLVGFALEAADGEENARRKLSAKNLDLIVLDSPLTVGAAESDFTVIRKDGTTNRYMSVSKDFLALNLVSLAVEVRL
jgi:phosphopantothenoylcysteine decarboxylase / phosphopantothenate---cysteine ligase